MWPMKGPIIARNSGRCWVLMLISSIQFAHGLSIKVFPDVCMVLARENGGSFARVHYLQSECLLLLCHVNSEMMMSSAA